MHSLKIVNTFKEPSVNLDFQKGKFEISGNCIPEDPDKIFRPITDWFHQNMSQIQDLKLELKFNYINSSSSRAVVRLLKNIEQYQIEDRNMLIMWYSDSEDDRDHCRFIASCTSIPFQIVTNKETE